MIREARNKITDIANKKFERVARFRWQSKTSLKALCRWKAKINKILNCKTPLRDFNRRLQRLLKKAF